MAIPKKRMSHARSERRRSHLALVAQNLRPCPNCQTQTLSHRMCANCGQYRGRLVIKQIAKNEKR